MTLNARSGTRCTSSAPAITPGIDETAKSTPVT